MQAVPLTPQEVVSVVTRKVRAYEAIGLDREAAVLAAASCYGAVPVKLAELVPPVVVKDAV